MRNTIFKQVALLFVLLSTFSTYSTVKIPRLVSDGMVLQRDSKVNVWGWANPSERVTLEMDGKLYHTITDANGKWKINIAPHKAGGPYTMVINGDNQVKIQNILFGDVWLCSGQSNMELPIYRVKPLYEKEIETATNDEIRFFTVPQKYNFKEPQIDFNTGSWQSVSPKSVLNFSAVAYFFATELYGKYRIPIGIINASLGGSPAQAWLSEEALKLFPNYLAEAYKFRNDSLIKEIESSDTKRSNQWYSEANRKDRGLKEGWKQKEYDTRSWQEMQVPGYWSDTEIGNVNGVVWFQKEFSISKENSGKSAFLNMGRIVDADSVYINGKFVGNITYQYPPRWYNVPADLLVEGANTITVRVVSNSGKGGFVLDKPYELKVGETTIDLKGVWKMKLGCEMSALPSQTFIRWKPMGLYNAMIAPLNNYSKKGILWYQGESNTGDPKEYEQLLPALIGNWREKFKQPKIPFLFVQLPNFMETKPLPSESNWALFREMQAKSLALPNTSMAVAIDAGDWNDIHPMNKKVIGVRLARLAQQKVYHDKNVNAVSPLYQSIKIVGSRIEVSFIGDTNGLKINSENQLHCIAIAGKDKKFVWAKCEIKNGKLLVWSETVANPIAVRYAWADNPKGPFLSDRFGNIVAPFRSDNW